MNTSVPRAMFASSKIVLSSASTSYYYVVYNSVALTDTTCDMNPSIEADKQTPNPRITEIDQSIDFLLSSSLIKCKSNLI